MKVTKKVMHVVTVVAFAATFATGTLAERDLDPTREQFHHHEHAVQLHDPAADHVNFV